MSREIDERVVVMDFDNSKFERGTRECVKDIEKLKKSLNFDSAKSFEELDKAANKVNFSGMHTAFDLLTNKSAWAFGIVINGMNSVISKAEHMATSLLKAFTIDPISSGFQAYEDKLNSTYTIMAATGDSMEYVTQKLKELNDYSDATIYSFQDMTRNVGKFTNAGISLEDTVEAMKGISNEAALAGANAAEQSRAMYNISQAMSMGYMQLIDWKSIENANMSIKTLKEEMAEVGVELGTLQKNEDGTFETAEHHFDTLQQLFKDGLQDRWLTNEVMLQTFKNFANVETEVGAKAYNAAKDIKSFSQMINVLKEQVKTSWGNSFEIIFGNVQQSVSYFKQIAEPLGNLFKTIGDARNNMLRKIFDNGYSTLMTQLSDMNISAEKFEETFRGIARARSFGNISKESKEFLDYMTEVEGEYENFAQFVDQNGLPQELVRRTLHELTDEAAKSGAAFDSMEDKLEYFQSVVDEVWSGTYSNNWDENNRERERLLTEANYDFAAVQDLVNATVDGHRLTLEDLNETQAAAIGFTNEEIEALKKFNAELDVNNSSIDKTIKAMESASNRYKMMMIIADIGKIISNTITSINRAWHEVMDDNVTSFFTSLISLIQELVHSLTLDETAINNFVDTLKGIFTVFKWITNLTLNFPLRVITSIARALGLIDVSGALSLTGSLGRMIVQFDKMLEVLDPLGRVIKYATEVITNFFDKLISYKDTMKSFGYWFMEGFDNGVSERYKEVVDFVTGIFDNLVQKIHDILGIGSPSKIMFAFGAWFVIGFIKGIASQRAQLKDALAKLFDFNFPHGDGFKNILKGKFEQLKATNALGEFLTIIKNALTDYLPFMEYIEKGFRIIGNFITKIVNFFKGLDYGLITAVAMMVGLIYSVNKFSKTVSAFVTSFGSAVVGINTFLTGFGKMMKATAFELYAEGIFKMAEALVIVALAIGILSKFKTANLIKAGAVVIGLGLVMTLLIALFTKLSTPAQALNTAAGTAFILTMCNGLIKIAVAMGILTFIIGRSKNGEWLKALAVMGGVLAAIGIFMAMSGSLLGSVGAGQLAAMGVVFTSFSLAMISIGMAMALIGMLPTKFILKAGAVILLILFCMKTLTTVATMRGQIKGIAGVAAMMIGFSVSVLLLASTMALIGMIPAENILKAGLLILALTALFYLLIGKASKVKSGKAVVGLGLMFMGFAASMAGITMAIAIIGALPDDNIEKALYVLKQIMGMLTTVVLVMGVLNIVDKFVNKGFATRSSTVFTKMAATLIALTVPMLAMAGLVIILGMIKEETIAKGIVAVTALIILLDSLMLCAGRVRPGAAKPLKSMAILFVALGATMIALSLVPTEKALGAALAMSMVIAAMSLALIGLKTLPSLSKSDIIKMGFISLMFVAIGGVIAVIAATASSTLGLVQTSAALSLAILAISASVAILSKLTSVVNPGALVAAVVLLGVMVGAVYLIGQIFLGLQGIDGTNMLKQATALSEIIAVLSTCALLIAGVGAIGFVTAVEGVGAFAIFVGALIGLGAAVIELAASDWMKGKVEKIGTVISNFLENFMPFLDKAKLIQNGQIADCVDLMKGIVELAMASKDLPRGTTAVAQYAKDLPGFAESIVEMSKILSQEDYDPQKTQDVIGILTALAKLENSLPSTGGKIQEFFGTKQTFESFGQGMKYLGEGFREFINETGEIILDKEKTDSIINAASAIAALENKLPRSGGLMNSILGDRQSLHTFSAQMPYFGQCVKEMTDKLGGITVSESVVTAATNGATAIAALENKLPKYGGKLESWTGKKQSLQNFSAQLPFLGTAMRDFSKELGDDFHSESVIAAGDAAEGLAKLESKLPTYGGKLSTWFGEKQTLANFASSLPDFAKGLKLASEELGANYDSTGIDNMAEAGTKLAQLEDSLPTLDGSVSKLFGHKETMDEFVDNFRYFIKGMIKLSTAAPAQDAKELASTTQQYMDALRVEGGQIKPINVELIEDCSRAGIAIAQLEDSLTKTGSAFEWFTGEKDLSHFSSNLGGFAKGMCEFSSELQNTDPANVANATSCVYNFDPKKMSDTLNGNAVYTISNIDPNLWTGFKATLVGYAESIKVFTESMKGVDTLSLSAAASSMTSLIVACKDITDSDFGGLTKMTTDLAGISKGCIDAFIAEFDKSYSRTEDAVGRWHQDVQIYMSNLSSSYKVMGKMMVEDVGKGVEEKFRAIDEDKNPANEFKIGMTAMTEEIRSKYGSFYDCGWYIAEGFKVGIKDNLGSVEDMGTSLVTTAERATREAAKIKSPSRVFMKDGKYIAEGFALGISNNTDLAKDAGTNLIETARNNIKSSIELLNSTLNSDLNFDPTITPMVNLDNVDAAASSISDMFNKNTIFSTNDINATIKQNQNRVDPTLTAIEGLKSELGKTGNTYNTINGITYDDGSNIHSAVGTLLHAAGVQRRK